ncbi:lysozyme inhibitor LprI family protein [Hyphobacterium sp. HN65]|uniref:Lysozyme inhibitor LprI family protein n=1 Tax=Hyphobacterium lacteum TaxID=3116575 RepID=A0ABU7LPA1_9PROT|nr:lysozyme inhibitor LprI family protein [Hyphobacterium sp. HN65]MEE2525164.1 lysozyme inhibitor LprI family protein [Hyphobacterium sp. HN65]
MKFPLVMSLFVFAGLAAAQDTPSYSAEERETFRNCLESGPDEQCRGVVMQPCLDQGAYTTLEMVDCAAREYELWDEVLNERYRDLMAQYRQDEDTEYLATQRERLRDAQRAWIISRDADCVFEQGMFEGGSLARMVAIDCLKTHTAQRAIWLGNQFVEG